MNRKDFKRNAHKIKDDIHTKTAMLVKMLSFEEITEAIRQDFGKKPRHAGNYDMGAARLSLMAHISLQQAQTAITRFHANNSKIRENFHFSIRSIITNKRLLVTPHGRQRQFFGRLNADTFKEAFSYIPQAVVSDHTKIDTLQPLEAETSEYASFLSESHDSLFFEVRDDKVNPFADRFKYWEEQPIHFDSGSFISDIELIIPLEIKSGENWYDLTEIK
jgi:DNA polymerase I-like protein with 3'-5' exonuclease and polymerase domains